MVFKCKMCGNNLEIHKSMKICTCDACDTVQTLPNLDNENTVNKLQKATYYRQNDEYDMASNICEQVLLEVPEEAEAHWELCLCRYGIKYVEEGVRRVPTCNRMQFASILQDENYLNSLKYGDDAANKVRQKDAEYIDTVQKQILTISTQEKPYDIFICYKDTDDTNQRTKDSVIAEEFYEALTQKGYHVFFSRVSLENKVGMKFEPYIFAALNSAKVMIVVGTKSEYFNAPWVKNEWSRFLALVRKSHDKYIYPCFRDMNPEDLPSELASLQVQDLSKIGFIQDMLRGIEKLIGNKKNTENVRVVNNLKIDNSKLSIITNVCSIGAINPNDLWPNGRYSNIINMNKHNVVFFHMNLNRILLANKRTISIRLTIYNNDNLTVHDDEVEIEWSSNYDRVSKGWIIKGNDGTFVPTGKYVAECSVEDSLPFRYSFTVTSEDNQSNNIPSNKPPTLFKKITNILGFGL